MKRACEQCDKIETEPLVGWLELGWADIGIQTLGQARLPVVFCTSECCIAWLAASPHRGNHATIQKAGADLSEYPLKPTLTSRQTMGDPNS